MSTDEAIARFRARFAAPPDLRDVEERAAVLLEDVELVGEHPIRAVLHETLAGPLVRLFVAFPGKRRAGGPSSAANTCAERDGWPAWHSGYVRELADVDRVLEAPLAKLQELMRGAA